MMNRKLIALLLSVMMLMTAASALAMTPGTYTGVAKGMFDGLTVEVTVTEDAITDVKVTEYQETAPGWPALEKIPADIVAAQTVEVDDVSGATMSSKGVKAAVRAAYQAYYDHMARVRARGQQLLREARAKGIPVVVLCGRPYHIDPEISHGIDGQIAQLGAVVVTEDAVNLEAQKFHVNVLNQWTYHARLYSAAKYVADCGDPGVNLVQLVSFGCGVDAITTDEVRSILQAGGKLYTQLKIDEISNPGAVRIRLRSLFAALGLGE